MLRWVCPQARVARGHVPASLNFYIPTCKLEIVNVKEGINTWKTLHIVCLASKALQS